MKSARAIAGYAFETLNLTRLICLVERDKLVSIRVAQKIGMALEKKGLDEKGSFLVYTMGREVAV